jgi:hypothetical protein
MNHLDPLDDTDATVELVRGGALQQCLLDRRQLVVGTVAGLLAQAALPRPGVLVAGAVLVGLGTTFMLPPLRSILTGLATGLEASALTAYGACLAAGASLGVEAPGWLPANSATRVWQR